MGHRNGYVPPRPYTYMAPTWSWASVHGAIRPADTSNIQFEVLSASVHPVTPNLANGQIKGGTVRVKGYLKSFKTRSLKNWAKFFFNHFLSPWMV